MEFFWSGVNLGAAVVAVAWFLHVWVLANRIRSMRNLGVRDLERLLQAEDELAKMKREVKP
jgi:hypothetical protein